MIENPATRTITLTLPDGTTREIMQYIDYSRNKTTDLVNGTVTYTGWVVIGDRSKTLMDGKVIDLVPYVLKGDQYYFAPVKLNNLVHVPDIKVRNVGKFDRTINLARLKAKYAHVLIVKDKSGQAYWIAYDA